LVQYPDSSEGRVEVSNNSLCASAQNLPQIGWLGKGSAHISPYTRLAYLHILSSLPILDVEHQAIPISDPTFCVEDGLPDGLNPSILTIRPPELVLILVRRSRSGRPQPPLHGRVAVIGMYEFEPPPAG